MIRDEMLARMSAPEFLEWQVYASLDPFSGLRGDFQAALIAMTVSNMSGKIVKKDMELKDFLLDFMPKDEATRPRPLQTPEEMHANFLRVFNFAIAKKKAEQAS